MVSDGVDGYLESITVVEERVAMELKLDESMFGHGIGPRRCSDQYSLGATQRYVV